MRHIFIVLLGLQFFVGSFQPAMANDPISGIVGIYEGARTIYTKKEAYSQAPFRLNPSPDKGTKVEPFLHEGRYYAALYERPTNLSAFQIYADYRQKLEGLGFEVVGLCVANNCHRHREDAWFEPVARSMIAHGAPKPISYFTNTVKNMTTVTMVRRTDRGDTWVSFISSQTDPGQQHKRQDNIYDNVFGYVIVDAAELPDEKKVVTTASEMQQSISQTGKIALYGIYFDTNSASLRAESAPALQEISKYLHSSPDSKIIIAGHTDSVGAFDYNVDLSKRRADAVIKELAQNHGVSTSRMTSFGAGMTAPVSTNETEEGRALNRRVELVKWVQ